MNGKSLFYIALGVLSAAIVCVVVGVVVYFTTSTTTAAFIAVVVMFIGGVMAVFPLIVLFCMGVTALVRRLKKRRD